MKFLDDKNTYTYIVSKADKQDRLDAFLVKKNPHKTRNQIQKNIHNISINGKKAKKAGEKIQEGDRILFFEETTIEYSQKGEDIPLDIIFEDKDILIINKPAGMVVHPALGNNSGTLLNALIFYLQKKTKTPLPERAGIVHRLDKNTSGLLMVAKNEQMHSYLSEQIKKRRITKGYTALVSGKISPEKGSIDAPITRSRKDTTKMAVLATKSAKDALTHYTVLAYIPELQSTLVRIQIITGRTHQIRVHFAAIGFPIIGDPEYGDLKKNANIKKMFGLSRQFLHASFLEIPFPDGTKKTFRSNIPQDLCFSLPGFSVLSDKK